MPESMTPTFTPAPVLPPHAHSGVMASSPSNVESCWMWSGANCQLQAGRFSYNGRVVIPKHLSTVDDATRQSAVRDAGSSRRPRQSEYTCDGSHRCVEPSDPAALRVSKYHVTRRWLRCWLRRRPSL